MRLSLIFLILFVACKNKTSNNHIQGNWKSSNIAYKAQYSITKEGEDLVCKILQYNDGTTKYLWNEKNPKYLMQKMKNKNNAYVDAISGATNQQIQLKLIHKDTIEKIEFINNQKTTEKWIRIK